MSTEERRQEEKEQRRRTILDAAETVLTETGRDEMTMADIADEARLSRSLLYVYFEDMDDIVLGVTRRGFRSMRKRFEAAVAESDSGLYQIGAVGNAYVAFSQEEPTYFDLVAQFESRTADADDMTERMRQCLAESDRVLEVMAKAIQNGIDDGSIRADLDPMETAVMLWGSTHGLIQLAANKGTGLKRRHGLSPDSMVNGGLAFLGAALAGRPVNGSDEEPAEQNENGDV